MDDLVAPFDMLLLHIVRQDGPDVILHIHHFERLPNSGGSLNRAELAMVIILNGTPPVRAKSLFTWAEIDQSSVGLVIHQLIEAGQTRSH